LISVVFKTLYTISWNNGMEANLYQYQQNEDLITKMVKNSSQANSKKISFEGGFESTRRQFLFLMNKFKEVSQLNSNDSF